MSDFPKEMRHPAYVPAVLSGYRRLAGGKTSDDPPGRPSRFPPVWVNNEDQEQYYASMGYVPVGVSDADEYRRKTIGEDRAGPYKHQEFPRWVYKPTDSGEVQQALVDTPADLEMLGDGWMTDLAEANTRAAEMRAAKAERAADDAEKTLAKAVAEAAPPAKKPRAVRAGGK